MSAGRPHPILLPAGLVIWSSSFVVLYAAASLGCGLGWQHVHLGPVTAHRIVLMVLLGLHLAALWAVGAALARTRPSSEVGRFLRLATWGTLAAGTVATVWTGLPALIGVSCAGH